MDVVVVHTEYRSTQIQLSIQQRTLRTDLEVRHTLVGKAGLFKARRAASCHVVDVPTATAEALAVSGVDHCVAVDAHACAEQGRDVAGAKAVFLQRDRRGQEGRKGDYLLVGKILLLVRVAQASG